MRILRTLVVALALVATPCLAAGQDPPTGGQEPPQGGGRGGRAAEPEIRPYERVITAEAKSDDGVFRVHRIKDRVYYEIPKSALGREFLWVSQIAKTTLGAGYGGQAAGNRVVRWERRGDRILLRAVSYEVVADPQTPIAKAVEASNYNPIVMAFNIEAIGKEDTAVIDVTRLFTTDVFEFSGRTRVGARAFDASRSFVERTVSFPENIEVEATHTYNNPPQEPGGGGRGGPPTPGGGRGGAPTLRPGSHSVLMHYSMVLLPEKPMQPRLFDDRVGYFSTSKLDYGKDEHRAPQRRYITRWRLEKKDPAAAVSEPVKPIVYWIDPATPAKWVPYLKKGVESWQIAFEAAGFKNAVIAKEAPSAAEDPDWSPEDARYSVIRWLPSTIENASGPHVHDPRSGEILETDIQFYHNVMNLARNWYFVQAGALDPRAKTLPLPDDLMGRLVEYRGRPRGRTHAGLPAQHESQLDVSRGAGSRREVGEGERPHAHADGLLALQLRCAAGRQDRRRRSRAQDRSLRQVGNDVGLQADSRCDVAGSREEDARRVGAAAGRDAVAPVLDGRLRRIGSWRAHRSRG